MSCNPDLIKQVCNYLGSDLDSEPCQMIKQHLEKCHNCEVYIDKIKKTVEIYRRIDHCTELPETTCKQLFASLNLDLPEPAPADSKPNK